MGAGGQGGRGEDDTEHADKYFVRNDGVFDVELPDTSPPVIGE
jgi:hypothetical protein